MSDNEDNKKKGFFSRLFGGSSSPEETNNEVITPKDSLEIPTKSALNKMKKADIVDVAKQNGLDLDISLTKAKLLEAWDLHFNQSSNPSAVDDAATAMAESAEATANIESLADEQASAEEACDVCRCCRTHQRHGESESGEHDSAAVAAGEEQRGERELEVHQQQLQVEHREQEVSDACQDEDVIEALFFLRRRLVCVTVSQVFSDIFRCDTT